MVYLYGRHHGRDDLLRRVGRIDQVGGLQILELADGTERSVRAALFRTGELSFLVGIDRGMDIINAEYHQIPLAWISPTGIVAPTFYESGGLGWLRGFPGGLMTTCGLTYMGAPTVDEGEPLGLHGRASYTPARLIHADGYWEDDDYVIALEGEVRETKVFEPNVALRRRIEARLGARTIIVHDTVTNRGWVPQPLMILYHVNIGFPVVDEGSRLICPSRLYVPRDAEAKAGAEHYDRLDQPLTGYREKVYFHHMLPDQEGRVRCAIVNEKLLGGLGVYIKYDKRELPRFTQWKMMCEGTYVVGMEPANALVVGRDKEREWGTLQHLNPQETREFNLELGVLVGQECESFKDNTAIVTEGRPADMVHAIPQFIQATSDSM